MLHFEPIEIRHKTLFQPFAEHTTDRTTEFSFATMYIWSHKFKLALCVHGDMLYLRSEAGEHPHYLLPRGSGNLADALSLLEQDTRGEYPLVLRGLTEPMMARLEEARPGRFAFTPHPEIADYLYSAQDLRELSGKKYHAKRNFIHRFETEFSDRWIYEAITRDNLDDVWGFQDRWCRKNDCAGNVSLQEESTAIALLLFNMEALGASGGLLRVDGDVVAFTAGSPIGKDAIDIHVEKADYDIVGAYPMIGRAFLRDQGAWASYVNREEDLGLEGLRRAKKSYHPVALLTKYTAVLR